MPYVGQKPADIISTAVDTVTGKFSGEVDAASLDISGNIDVDGVTNLDVTDIDGTLNVAGETTLQTHLNMGDSDIIKLGDSADLQIHHSSSGYSSIVDSGTGHLFIGGSEVNLMNPALNEYLLRAITDSSVSLYHDNSVKLATTNTGIAVTGAITASSGDVTITDGNLVVASGHGINFAATGQAGGMSSELLSDYEEGTFTPAYSQASANATQLGKYTKIGNMVIVNIRYQGTHTASSTALGKITGLPFTIHDNCSHLTINTREYSSTGKHLHANLNPSTTESYSFTDASNGGTFGAGAGIGLGFTFAYAIQGS